MEARSAAEATVLHTTPPVEDASAAWGAQVPLK